MSWDLQAFINQELYQIWAAIFVIRGLSLHCGHILYLNQNLGTDSYNRHSTEPAALYTLLI